MRAFVHSGRPPTLDPQINHYLNDLVRQSELDALLDIADKTPAVEEAITRLQTEIWQSLTTPIFYVRTIPQSLSEAN